MIKFEDFLGEDLLEKHKRIFPALREIAYEMDMPSGFFDNMVISRSSGWIKETLRLFFYHTSRWKKTNDEQSVFLSETILFASRYYRLVKELVSTGKVCAKKTIRTTSLSKKNCFLRDVRVVDFRDDIVSPSVLSCAKRTYDLFNSLRDSGLCCAQRKDEVDSLLCDLEKELVACIELVKQLFLEKHISTFITINRHNFEDLIIIMACKECQVWTKELMHSSSCTLPVDYERRMVLRSVSEEKMFSENLHDYNCTDEICFWNDNEVEFFKKYKLSESRLLYGDKVVFSVVGCPELLEEQLEENMEHYKKRDVITLFVPFFNTVSVPKNISNGEALNYIAKEREKLYFAISQLAKQTHYDVYIKYHPMEPKEYYEAEAEFVRTNDFIVLGSSSEELDMCLAESKAVFGTASGTLYLALAYGCKVYALSMGDEDFDFCGMDIQKVSLEEISTLSLNTKSKNMVVPINIERLISKSEMKRTSE